ncbi:MAG: hypothetical protein ACR2MD_19655 [Aridibacter sp.]|jgi:hypothetical protein
MATTVAKLNSAWISETRQYFLDFLELTSFPHPVRDGTRGSRFDYPEWLIMFIAVLAVKCREKTYLGIHRMAVKYWTQIAQGLDLSVISESQLRERLKKICHTPGKPAGFIFQIFPGEFFN